MSKRARNAGSSTLREYSDQKTWDGYHAGVSLHSHTHHSRVSHVVVMPEYRETLTAQKLTAASDVLGRDNSDRLGRVHWTDRVTWERDGHVRRLSFHWPDGGPLWVRSSVRAFQLLSSPVMAPMIGAALDTMEGVRQS